MRHRLRDRVEELGEVSTDFALDADRHDGPREVAALHAPRRVVERFLDRTAETGLGERPLQLAADRFARLFGDGLEALHEREAGPHRTREQVERVGKLRLELLEPRCLLRRFKMMNGDAISATMVDDRDAPGPNNRNAKTAAMSAPTGAYTRNSAGRSGSLACSSSCSTFSSTPAPAMRPATSDGLLHEVHAVGGLLADRRHRLVDVVAREAPLETRLALRRRRTRASTTVHPVAANAVAAMT